MKTGIARTGLGDVSSTGVFGPSGAGLAMSESVHLVRDIPQELYKPWSEVVELAQVWKDTGEDSDLAMGDVILALADEMKRISARQVREEPRPLPVVSTGKKSRYVVRPCDNEGSVEGAPRDRQWDVVDTGLGKDKELVEYTFDSRSMARAKAKELNVLEAFGADPAKP